jgi:hypothetical protein
MIKITSLFLIALLLNSCGSENAADPSSSCAGQTAVSSSYTCSTGFTGAPSWITSTFTCVTVTTGGTYYTFLTDDIPNYNSGYFGDCDSRYESAPSGNSYNPNIISDQNYSVSIPKDPRVNGTATASTFDIVGVSTNGIALFNNEAAPGDSLANELLTMDSGTGHPTNGGNYHYHSEPSKLTTSGSGVLIGIMKDGFPIYGPKEADNTTDPVYVANNGGNCSVARMNTELNDGSATVAENCQPLSTVDNFHCHTITGASIFINDFTCHYHANSGPTYLMDNYAGDDRGTFTN